MRSSACCELAQFGGLTAFAGPVATVRCFEDNVLVKGRVAEPGEGRVLVIDGGGSFRVALLGDMIAGLAAANGWAGIVLNGCVRDVAVLRHLPIGIKALGTCPRPSGKEGAGDVDVPVELGGITIHPGARLVATRTASSFSSEGTLAQATNRRFTFRHRESATFPSRVLTRPLRRRSYPLTCANQPIQSRPVQAAHEPLRGEPPMTPEHTYDRPAEASPPLLVCQSCGAKTVRFARGWRGLFSKNEHDAVTVIVVCPNCRRSTPQEWWRLRQ